MKPTGSTVNAVGTSEKQLSVEAQLLATANMIPGHVWYATPSGALIFVNSRSADYLGLPKDYPLRFGIDLGRERDSHISFLHPDDHEETRKPWSSPPPSTESNMLLLFPRTAHL
jgi:hypothetical protein